MRSSESAVEVVIARVSIMVFTFLKETMPCNNYDGDIIVESSLCSPVKGTASSLSDRWSRTLLVAVIGACRYFDWVVVDIFSKFV